MRQEVVMSIVRSVLILSCPECPNVFLRKCESQKKIEQMKANSKAKVVLRGRDRLPLWHCRHRGEAAVLVHL